ncbi:MAG TPA: FAD/NAD(P)-binding protein [Gaiella sp.]|nr:FAD/NAD(P)-binding protein [Gaiella sp.]
MQETADTWTLELEPLGASGVQRIRPRAGQFDMLYAFGVGEVPISTSGDHDGEQPLTHTIRAVGAVSRALCALGRGGIVGVRGPFGTEWPLADASGGDLVVVAGGIGLAPLRPAIRHALERRDDYGAVSVLVGARTPEDILFVEELERWRARLDAEVDVTVDAAAAGWHGRVGLVTTLIPGAVVDAGKASAFVCGPEVMMTFVVRALIDRGVALERIWVSMERNMRCAVGHCGHCQLGPTLICRDGAVFPAGAMQRLMEVREL